MRNRFVVPGAAWLLAMASISTVAGALVLYGSLTGNVTDPSGAAVPRAKVETLDVGTGVGRQTIQSGWRFTKRMQVVVLFRGLTE